MTKYFYRCQPLTPVKELLAEPGFDFYQDKFIKLFKRKLSAEGRDINYRKDFGLSADKLALLRSQIDTHLVPVIRADERFDLQKVFDKFNGRAAQMHVQYLNISMCA